MKPGWIVAGVGVIALAGALAFYLLLVPDRLASDYKDGAQPEQEQLRDAMRPVYRTLSVDTFYTDDRSVRKADNPDEYVHAIDKTTSTALRRLAPVRKRIERARRALEEADHDALTETPDWPLLGGRGGLDDANQVADDERGYLSEARAFLKRYDQLVKFWQDDVRAIRRYGVTFGRGFDSIPDSPTSPGQITGPIDRTARQLGSHLRRYRKIKAPPGLRRYRREHIELVQVLVRELRGLSSAVRARDLGRIEAFDRRMSRAVKRSNAEVSIGHLVYRSNYAQDIRSLRARERALARALARL